jgi:hypothetical protein
VHQRWICFDYNLLLQFRQQAGPLPPIVQVLGVPVMWMPQSYGGSGQHGPDEHGLGSLFRDGLGLMAGLFWDVGEQGRPA